MAGFFSAPNEAGVSDWTISRIGTRRSRREPSTYTLREFGIGLTAASSTRAVWARNFGLAFMALLSRTDRRGAKGPAAQRFPAAALSASGSKGLLSPAQTSSPGQDPYVARRDLTPSGRGWQASQLRGRIANVSLMQLRSPSRL